MHNVQYYLRTLRREKLLDTYIKAHPPNYDHCLHGKVKNVKRWYRRLYRNFIERLSQMPVEYSSEGRCIIYARKCLHIGDPSDPPMAYDIVHEKELLEQGLACDDYCYDYTPQTEIIGFLVADTPFTRENIYELIADVLEEASWYGFYQEHVPNLAELEKQAEAAMARARQLAEDKEEIEAAEASGGEPSAEASPAGDGSVCEKVAPAPETQEVDEETRVTQALYDAIRRYNAYYREKELSLIYASLKAETPQ